MGKLTKNPEKSRLLLKTWWEREMNEAGLAGSVTVHHHLYEDDTPTWSAGKTLLKAVAGTEQLAITHKYLASIPNAPWSLDTAVLSTDRGVVVYVTYTLTFPRRIPNELQVIYQDGKLTRVCRFHGEHADRFNEQKDLVKQLTNSLSYFYSHWGTSVSTDSASYELTPQKEGTKVHVTTTLSANNPFGWGRKGLGLVKVLGGLNLLEKAL